MTGRTACPRRRSIRAAGCRDGAAGWRAGRLAPGWCFQLPRPAGGAEDGRDDRLIFYVFDLLHLNGWDLRPCALIERKRVLSGLADWQGMLRYSDHLAGEPRRCGGRPAPWVSRGSSASRPTRPTGAAAAMLAQGEMQRPRGVHRARLDPAGRRAYRPRRAACWLLRPARGGCTTPAASAPASASRSSHTSPRLGGWRPTRREGMLVSGDPIEGSVTWVRPELVIEVQFIGWSGAGRVRHPVYLGMREDKPADEVVRPVADPEAERVALRPRRACDRGRRARWHGAAPPVSRPPDRTAPPVRGDRCRPPAEERGEAWAAWN